MDTHNKHHYIPKFLLCGWHSGNDEKLSQMRWVCGQIAEKRYKAKSVANERHLYSMRKFDMKPNQEIEPTFMSKHIDDPAAIVHKAMLANGLCEMSEKHRHAWTLFLVSLVFRGPGAIEQLRECGIDAIRSQFPDGVENTEDLADSAIKLRELARQRAPSLLDFGSYRLPELIQSSSYNKLLMEAEWGIRRIDKSKEKLLIGDRPLVLFGPQTKLDLIYLPLAPNVAFFISRSAHMKKWVDTMSDSNLVRKMNKGIVEQASLYVWGNNFEHRRLLERRLQPTPAGRGVGIGPRPPL